MKTLIQKNTDKLTRSLTAYDIDNVYADIDGVLYGLLFQYDFENIIFTIDKPISTEINNFIVEFQDKKNIVMYYLNQNDDYTKTFNKCKHISKHGVKLKGDHTELPEYFIDTNIYKRTNNSHRNDKYCVFLDHIQEIPEELLCILYPNTNLKINMFDSPYIRHDQNLGMIESELYRQKILSEYKYYIPINNNYIYEAVACGCEVINIDCQQNINKVSVKGSATSLEEIAKVIL